MNGSIHDCLHQLRWIMRWTVDIYMANLETLKPPFPAAGKAMLKFEPAALTQAMQRRPATARPSSSSAIGRTRP